MLERNTDESILNSLIHNGEVAQGAFVRNDDARDIAEAYSAWVGAVRSRLRMMKDRNIAAADFETAQTTSSTGAPGHHDAAGTAAWGAFEVRIAVLKSYSKALNREMCDAELMERPNGSKD